MPLVVDCHGMGVFDAEAQTLAGPAPQISGYHRVQGMGVVIKLRTARKQAKRELGQRVAATNRLLHGRSPADRSLDTARATKARRDLDQHRIETGDER